MMKKIILLVIAISLTGCLDIPDVPKAVSCSPDGFELKTVTIDGVERTAYNLNDEGAAMTCDFVY